MLSENNMHKKEKEAFKVNRNGNKGLDDYRKFLNNKYKINEIKRLIRDFSFRY